MHRSSSSFLLVLCSRSHRLIPQQLLLLPSKFFFHRSRRIFSQETAAVTVTATATVAASSPLLVQLSSSSSVSVSSSLSSSSRFHSRMLFCYSNSSSGGSSSTSTCSSYWQSQQRRYQHTSACNAPKKSTENRLPLVGGGGGQQRLLRRHERSQSTAVAAAVSDDDEEEEDDSEMESQEAVVVTKTSSSSSLSRTTTPIKKRLRLEELRERLRTEDEPWTLLQAKKERQQQQQQRPSKTKQPSNANQKHSSFLQNIPESPIALRHFLNQLPVPEHPQQVLQDRYQRHHSYLRISLTERCNLRCTYCMPEAGVPLQPASHLLQTFEILQLAQHFHQAGVTKFRLTGGEPTLRADLIDICQGLAALQPTSLGMTTNGVTLYKQLDDLVAAGLTNVNISLDTLQPDKFAALTRRPAAYLDRVWQSLTAALQIAAANDGQLSVKLNCVVMRGVNDDEVADFIRLTTQFPHLQVRFIEYMPFSDNGWNWDKCLPYAELLEQLQTRDNLELTPLPAQDPHDTTKWFRFHNASDGSNGSSKIGFITSMSEHFCGGCNRLRLTADGQIKVCLFDGQTEVSLRNVIRLPDFEPADLDKMVHLAVRHKHFKLGGHQDPSEILRDAGRNRPMTLIGG